MDKIENVNSFKDFIALYKNSVYNRITDYMTGIEPEAYIGMVRCYIDRKGQYRRPSYVLLWNLLYGGKFDDALLPAASQQVSEDWLLMIDDWMDDNDLRRGGKSAHLIYGDRYAINAASNLQSINWKIVYDACKQLGDPRQKRYFDKFYDIINVTHQGQYRDVHLTRDVKDITKFTKEDYYESIHAKSAYYSVYGPMQQGAIIAGAPEEVINQIKEYGTPAGLAFQIKDDILDCTSTAEQLGKSIGTDVRDGVKTVILWSAVQNASSTTLNKMKYIYMKDPNQKTKEDVSYILDKFNELGSIDYAEKEMKALIEKSIDNFNKYTTNIQESNIKDLAREGIGYVSNRKN